MAKHQARRRLAENLRIIRLINHWSQEELAERLGLDRSYVGNMERAKKNVGIDTLEKIAEALGLGIGDLTGEPDMQDLAERILGLVQGAIDGRRMRIRDEGAIYG